MNRVVVFANGDEVSAPTIAKTCRAGDLIVCADGGAAQLARHSIIPNIVVGDFDSLPRDILEQLKANNVELMQHPADKDQTDLELALDIAAEHNPDEIIILGALGGRVDHFLGNIMLLTCLERYSCPVSIAGDNVYITAIHPGHSLQFEGEIGSLFSLIPISASVEGVCVIGAKWPLNNATLIRGRALTISNVLAENQVSISVSKGLMLLVSPGVKT